MNRDPNRYNLCPTCRNAFWGSECLYCTRQMTGLTRSQLETPQMTGLTSRPSLVHQTAEMLGLTSPQISEPVRRHFDAITADDELSAIHIINQVLGELDGQQVSRVLSYVSQRHSNGT